MNDERVPVTGSLPSRADQRVETRYWSLSSIPRLSGDDLPVAADEPYIPDTETVGQVMETIADIAAFQEAAALLRHGKTVAFPTETVYGLGADARNDQAVSSIFMAKGRPSDNPLIVHIADRAQLDELVEHVDELAEQLIRDFWPGPLTLVLPVRAGVLSARVTAGLNTVAVRMPDHAVALRLLAEAACPVAAPSANLSGRPSPTTAAHVLEDLDGRIDGILDAGPTGVGVESTVVETSPDGKVTILRPGGITAEQLMAVSGVKAVLVDPGLKEAANATDGPTAPRSPGVKYTHYAPRGTMYIVEGGSVDVVAARIRTELTKATESHKRAAVLAYDEHLGAYSHPCVYSLGSLAAPEQAAQRLYSLLRRCDEEGVDLILAEACPLKGMGAAVMNRMLKAAGNRIIHTGN
ncbi:L-threonylcarbamoyladenylate synthase [Paenibacillus massiliensis]|uniref:L-threonylcarbamoyladenylate synthase n=1 Tax=Paenibacillus massiliensis TaxID=225917 RepID=UPI0004118D64